MAPCPIVGRHGVTLNFCKNARIQMVNLNDSTRASICKVKDKHMSQIKTNFSVRINVQCSLHDSFFVQEIVRQSLLVESASCKLITILSMEEGNKSPLMDTIGSDATLFHSSLVQRVPLGRCCPS